MQITMGWFNKINSILTHLLHSSTFSVNDRANRSIDQNPPFWLICLTEVVQLDDTCPISSKYSLYWLLSKYLVNIVIVPTYSTSTSTEGTSNLCVMFCINNVSLWSLLSFSPLNLPLNLCTLACYSCGKIGAMHFLCLVILYFVSLNHLYRRHSGANNTVHPALVYTSNTLQSVTFQISLDPLQDNSSFP